MFFIGGGGIGGPGGRFCGQYPRAAKNPLKTPPKTPPFFKFGSGGVGSMISDFRKSPPPCRPCCSWKHFYVEEENTMCTSDLVPAGGGVPLY